MKVFAKKIIILGAFLLVALFGSLISLSAPYVASGDELVYLTGALQVKDGGLPDAYMLQGYDYNVYLYPKLIALWYESLGHEIFKTAYLFFLVVVTGISAYGMFRAARLFWVPSLLLAVVALMPRFSSGTEIFGVLTFHEAIGRQAALPLFFIGTTLLFKRMTQGKSLWPIFALLGLCLFLHPVTVMLFAFISIISVAFVRLFQRVKIMAIIRESVASGAAFVLSGAYFFVDVFSRLSHGVEGEGVSSHVYTQAIVFRNAWEFQPESLLFFRHMAVVSTLFVLAIIVYYFLPKLRTLRAKYPPPYGRDLMVWGLSMAFWAPVLTLALPGINLYFMEHGSAPYIFQQWSRISKFYYLGIFIALIPVTYVLWNWYLEWESRFKAVVVGIIFMCALGSSSFPFEVLQYMMGYKNFEKSYIPQMLSGISDDVTPGEYREVCRTLEKMGATPESGIISSNFAFRYYCKADLYVTLEEGAAYQQLKRSDVVAWYSQLLTQREALNEGDLVKIFNFANNVNADFVILPKISKYAHLTRLGENKVFVTTKYIILRVESFDM